MASHNGAQLLYSGMPPPPAATVMLVILVIVSFCRALLFLDGRLRATKCNYFSVTVMLPWEGLDYFLPSFWHLGFLLFS